jgi:hypothetical protein
MRGLIADGDSSKATRILGPRYPLALECRLDIEHDQDPPVSYAISFFGIFARIIDSLAWPAVAVFLIWILRDVLRQGLADLMQRSRRKLSEASDPRAGLVLAMHEIQDQTQATLRSGVLDPAQDRAAREFVDQLQQVILAIVSSTRSAGPVREAASGQGARQEEAARLEAPKRQKKRKSAKG